jgi:hypothetical protein
MPIAVQICGDRGLVWDIEGATAPKVHYIQLLKCVCVHGITECVQKPHLVDKSQGPAAAASVPQQHPQPWPHPGAAASLMKLQCLFWNLCRCFEAEEAVQADRMHGRGHSRWAAALRIAVVAAAAAMQQSVAAEAAAANRPPALVSITKTAGSVCCRLVRVQSSW